MYGDSTHSPSREEASSCPVSPEGIVVQNLYNYVIDTATTNEKPIVQNHCTYPVLCYVQTATLFHDVDKLLNLCNRYPPWC